MLCVHRRETWVAVDYPPSHNSAKIAPAVSDDAKSAWTRFELPGKSLLPTACPACLGPGTRDLAVPHVERLHDTEFVAHYCELCAEELWSARTRRLAGFLAACLLGISTATGLAFLWGTRLVLLQFACGAAAGALLPFVSHSLSRGDTVGPSLWLVPRPSSSVPPHRSAARAAAPPLFLARRRDWVALVANGSAEVKSTAVAPPRARFRLATWLPPLIALAWTFGVQQLGRSHVWVLSAEQDVVFLVDQRVVGEVPASLEETPTAGRFGPWLAGRHTFTLLHEDGRVLAEREVLLVPGQSYVFGLLPERSCLFLERRRYGSTATPTSASRSREPLRGDGALFEIPGPVDAWFVPLPPPSDSSTSGGQRAAVRLLPCSRGSSARPPAR